ncbi:MAG: nucleotidyltransferase domain-containing protein [Epsilonproteobacteria bacterium]|nr:nucleotidyltransferase domain-containing protein [Campylobacterota bacterium]
MQQKILENLQILKSKLQQEGFIIDGVFGSHARGEATPQSDIDILYHLDDAFYKNFSGFKSFKKLDEIKQNISSTLGLKVDLAPKNNLSKTAQKYILSEVVYV